MKKWILILTLCFISLNLFSATNVDKEIKDLKDRIEQVEKENKELNLYKTMYDKQFDVLVKNSENNKEALANKFDKLNQENFSIFLSALLITVFGTLFSIAKINSLKEKINDVVDNSVNEHVNKEVKMRIDEESRKLSNKILDEYRERILNETVLRLSKRITILSKQEAQNPLIKKFFQHKEYGFKSPVYLEIEEYEYKNDADLIIFDNSSGIRNANNVDEIFSQLMSSKVNIENSKVVFLYVSFEGIFFDKKIKNSNRINAVTSEITLYEQIMNSLKYQDFLEKSST